MANDSKAQIKMQGDPQEFLNERFLQQNEISIILKKHLFQKANGYMCGITIICGTSESLP